MTRPGRCVWGGGAGGGFSSPCSPTCSQPQEYDAPWIACGCSHRSRLCVQGPGGPCRGPQAHVQGSLGRPAVLRCGLGQALGEGAPSPISFSWTLIPDPWGQGRKTAMESRSFVSFSSFRARRWRPRREDALAGGAEGCVEGRGKHHWPSESGIETDGRGEQYYHSEDPMGAIQQIPY